MRRILIVLAVLAVAGYGLLMATYEVVGVDFTSFMEDQPSIGYQESPRRLPAADAVPLSRPAYLDVAAGVTNPVPADEVSLQRGKILFDLNCALCHGPQGKGDGPITRFWREDARRPANLTDPRIGQYPDGTLYGIVTRGLGGMPPHRENMTEREYWDVINYVRSLQP
jgi:mono/diheme cytochrome c family protein